MVNTMFTKTFEQLGKKDVAIAGGKGASLGEMTSAGISVPSGFVVLSGAFDYFLENNNLLVEIEAELEKINFSDPNSVEETSERLRGLVEKVEIPQEIIKEIQESYRSLVGSDNHFFVAVRSSATAEDSLVASWAGELESYLFTNDKKLLTNIKSCWSSLFTPRALFYRHEKDLIKEKVSVAVVVQKMINSEVSGITFTVHPVTKEINQMIIEAGWGLGEAIVGGLITPDNYVIDKTNFNLLDINISEQSQQIVQVPKGGTKMVETPRLARDKQKLTGKEIIELAKICKKIEDHYHSPQDIEWAYVNRKFYIVQSRPITTL